MSLPQMFACIKRRTFLYLLMFIGVVFLLVACSEKTERRVHPMYADYFTPKYAELQLIQGKKVKVVPLNIDHINRRIYNKEYLAYGTKLDSARLRMVISNQIRVEVENIESKKTTSWNSSETDKKLDVSGGKLLIHIKKKDKPSLTYDFRLLSYGYDPDKLKWQRESIELPIEATEGNVISIEDKHYFLAKDNSAVKLYSLKFDPIAFEEITDASLPTDLNPKSIMVDKSGQIWGITKKGTLHNSMDLKNWKEYDKAMDISFSQILRDNGTKENFSLALTAKIKNSEEYHFVTTSPEGIVMGDKVPDNFPIKDAYVYTYNVSSIEHSNVFGGISANDKPTKTSFFTSDGLHWAKTPYSSIVNAIPAEGGLFLKRNANTSLMLIGGEYDGKISALIKVSDDRGITWKELSENQKPDKNFKARKNATGLIVLDNKGIQHVYILGGIVDNHPSKEIWHGYLDTTGGILNSYQ